MPASIARWNHFPANLAIALPFWSNNVQASTIGFIPFMHIEGALNETERIEPMNDVKIIVISHYVNCLENGFIQPGARR